MRVFKIIPTLFYTVIVYNILALLGGDVLSAGLWKIGLISGAEWSLSVNELLLAISVLFLYIEIFKSTRTTTSSVIDHALSMGLFIICLLEFIMIERMGSSTFFIITLICLLDVVAGFTVTISTARRDFGVGAHAMD